MNFRGSTVEFKKLTPEQSELHRQRLNDAKKGVHFSITEQQADEALSVYYALVQSEVALAAPSLSVMDYDNGVAEYEDQVLTTQGIEGTILSTEHATAHMRLDESSGKLTRKLPEVGTAALGHVTANATNSTHITMLGRQTGDPNMDVNHPYHACLKELIRQTDADTFISLHGMASGHIASLEDQRVFDVMVGVGNEPNERTLSLAQSVASSAKENGLRVGINQPFMTIRKINGNYCVMTGENGDIVWRVFSAPKLATRGVVESYSKQERLNMAAIQIEIAPHLRIKPIEIPHLESLMFNGPYLGHLAITKVLANAHSIEQG